MLRQPAGRGGTRNELAREAAVLIVGAHAHEDNGEPNSRAPEHSESARLDSPSSFREPVP